MQKKRPKIPKMHESVSQERPSEQSTPARLEKVAQITDHVAFTDFDCTTSRRDCLFVGSPDSPHTITYLNGESAHSYKFRCIVRGHEDTLSLTSELVNQFMPYNQNSLMFHRVVVNVADQFDFNNNGGFNLDNFQESLFQGQEREAIARDWQDSFIGTFTHTLLAQYWQLSSLQQHTRLMFSFMKFDGNQVVDFNDPMCMTQQRTMHAPDIEPNYPGMSLYLTNLRRPSKLKELTVDNLHEAFVMANRVSSCLKKEILVLQVKMVMDNKSV